MTHIHLGKWQLYSSVGSNGLFKLGWNVQFKVYKTNCNYKSTNIIMSLVVPRWIDQCVICYCAVVIAVLHWSCTGRKHGWFSADAGLLLQGNRRDVDRQRNQRCTLHSAMQVCSSRLGQYDCVAVACIKAKVRACIANHYISYSFEWVS